MLLFVPLLFTVGAVFGYYVVVPSAVHFLYYWAADEVNPLPRARSIYPFEMTMMFVMGIIFEMPAAVWVLTRAHVLTSKMNGEVLAIDEQLVARPAGDLDDSEPLEVCSGGCDGDLG